MLPNSPQISPVSLPTLTCPINRHACHHPSGVDTVDLNALLLLPRTL